VKWLAFEKAREILGMKEQGEYQAIVAVCTWTVHDKGAGGFSCLEEQVRSWRDERADGEVSIVYRTESSEFLYVEVGWGSPEQSQELVEVGGLR
jgi:hypothetical protein